MSQLSALELQFAEYHKISHDKIMIMEKYHAGINYKYHMVKSQKTQVQILLKQ